MNRDRPKRRALARHSAALRTSPPTGHKSAFREITTVIRQARRQVYPAVNVGLPDLYWGIETRISRRIASRGRGQFLNCSPRRLHPPARPQRTWLFRAEPLEDAPVL